MRRLTVLLLTLSYIYGYPTGAPDQPGVCATLTPGHPTPLQGLGSAPFELKVFAKNLPWSVTAMEKAWFKNLVKNKELYQEVQAQAVVSLVRTDGSSFKGFIIQARDVQAGQPIGEFHIIDQDTTKQACVQNGGSTVTHTDNKPKKTVSVAWIPPTGYTGEVQFLASAVEKNDPSGSVFWTGLTSDTVTVQSTAGKNIQLDVFEGMNSTIDLKQCGQSMGCFKFPSDCTDIYSCSFIMAWIAESDRVQFKLYSHMTSSNQWLSMGLSHDKDMGEDSVTDCIFDGEVVKVQSSYNPARGSNELVQCGPIRYPGLIPGSLEGMYRQGMLQCNFTKYLDYDNYTRSTCNDSYKLYDLKGHEYYILLAIGPTGADEMTKVMHSDAIRSLEKVDLSSQTYTVLTGAYKQNNLPSKRAHGCLMVIAWVLLAGVGVLLPRYYKLTWPSRTLLGKPLWFMLHVPLMAGVVIFTLTAIIVIFVAEKGYAHDSDKPAHPIIGLITMSLVIINPVIALFRPPPTAKPRIWFNVAHFTIGRTAQILALTNIVIGLRMLDLGVGRWATWLMIVYIDVHIVVEIVLTIERHRNKRPSKYLSDQVQEDSTRYTTQADLFRTITLAAYTGFTVCFTIALICGIATGSPD